MHTSHPVYRFGPFELDSGHRRLTNGGKMVFLPDRQMDVLLVLVARANEIVSKRELGDLAWHGVEVTDNSLVQAVKGLRERLDLKPGGVANIETFPRKGYRFVAGAREDGGHAAGTEQVPAVSIAARMAPYRPFVDGRAGLESFDLDAIARARQAFIDVLREKPNLAEAHIGLANAYLMEYEATRVDARPDRELLDKAEWHARRACELEPRSGDAWSTLAMVFHRKGAVDDAQAAARKAVAEDKDEWRHYLRFAYVSWGVDRLRTAGRVLSICSDIALAHWFRATVFAARGAFDLALDHLRAGCAALDAQGKDTKRFVAVGLYWLTGLILLAQGDEEGAMAAWRKELALEVPGHVYARECCANTYYAIGALLLRQRRLADARAAFEQALARVPTHPLAAIGQAAAGGPIPDLSSAAAGADPVHLAIGRAAVLVLQGEHAAAADLCAKALAAADPGSSGWLLPVEPLLNVAAHSEEWTAALATLRARAF